MRWDAGRGFHVPGLVVKECATVDDMLNVRSRDTCPDALWCLSLAKDCVDNMLNVRSRGACPENICFLNAKDTVREPCYGHPLHDCTC